MEEEITNYSTFSAFRPHFDALARGGYFKIVLKPISRTKRSLHNAYRYFLIFFIILYNVQHVIRVVLVRHSTDLIVDTLFILLTTLNTLGKEAAFNLRSQRIDDIINIIDGPSFSASRQYHVQVLKSNAMMMSRLLNLYHFAVLICGSLWAVFPVVNRALGQPVPFTAYFPFKTMESPMFELVLTYMSILITFQAYGNTTMDCTIVGFFAQARVQIQLLRYNLEQLVEFNNVNKDTMLISSNISRYMDDGKEKNELQQRLKRCVVHYKHIIRFVEEVESIFREAMALQFFVSAWVICMTTYKIVGLNLMSAEFVSIVIYLGCMLAQLFIYSYYGTQLQVESDFINQSIYCCDWLSVSPRFRRQLLVMMEFCSRPLMPRIAYIIPMSLETYFSVLRSSYTLFTFLNR